MNVNDMLHKRMESITNPALNYPQMVRYAANELKCMGLVADMWGITLKEVFLIVERIENEDGEIQQYEPPRETLDDDHKIFWDFIAEMEPFDLKEWGLE